MTKLPPYIIQHFDLSKPLDVHTFSSLGEAGYYCLFWWQYIPLGHLFIYSNEYFNDHEFRKKIVNAIGSTIDFYMARHEMGSRYRNAFLTEDYELFQKIMNEIFSGYSSASVPETVDVSVIICTRNRSKDLDLCLQSLIKQVCQPKEIIVVDNAPYNEDTKKVVARYENVKYCAEPRSGLSIARNTGIRNATCPIIAWTDDDVTVHPFWTFRIWEVFQVPEIASVTGLVLAAQLDTESQQLFEMYWPFNRGYTDKLFDAIFFQNSLKVGPRVWDIGAGANMAFRKSIFEDLGYFDERLGAGASGCNEDSEMWYRVLAKGYNIHYTPRAVVFHKHREQMTELKKQLFQYMRGFTAAALIQQDQNEQAGYRKHVIYGLAKYFFRLLIKGFPTYQLRYKTLLYEIRGYVAGFQYYRKNRDKTSQPDSI